MMMNITTLLILIYYHIHIAIMILSSSLSSEMIMSGNDESGLLGCLLLQPLPPPPPPTHACYSLPLAPTPPHPACCSLPRPNRACYSLPPTLWWDVSIRSGGTAGSGRRVGGISERWTIAHKEGPPCPMSLHLTRVLGSLALLLLLLPASYAQGRRHVLFY